MKTNDRPLTDLMKALDTGAAQLPDFQRGWYGMMGGSECLHSA